MNIRNLTLKVREPLILSLLYVFSLTQIFSQDCTLDLEWSVIANGYIHDFEFQEVTSSQLDLGPYQVDFYLKEYGVNKSTINGNVSLRPIGQRSDAFVLSLHGSDTSHVCFSLKFNEAVESIGFDLLDIDRDANATWQDSVVVECFLDGMEVHPSAITYSLNNLNVYQNGSSLKGLSNLDDRIENSGNVHCEISERFDSIAINYYYGSDLQGSYRGEQHVGISPMEFTPRRCDVPFGRHRFDCLDDNSAIFISQSDLTSNTPLASWRYEIIKWPEHGKLSWDSIQKGMWYEPYPLFFFTDSFVIEICGDSAICDQSQVNIEFDFGNSVITNCDHHIGGKNEKIVGDLMYNDYGLNSTPIAIRPSFVVGPKHGVLEILGDGSFTYTPKDGFIGEDEFDYLVCTADGTRKCEKNKVILLVKGEAGGCQGLYRSVGECYKIGSLGMLSTNLLSNDLNRNEGSNDQKLRIIEPPRHGVASLLANGAFTYKNGVVPYYLKDSVVYEVSWNVGTCQGRDTSVVHIMIDGDYGRCAPNNSSLHWDLYQVCKNSNKSGCLLDNDNLVDGLYVNVGLDPSNEVSHGTVHLGTDGCFQYTPDKDYTGTDAFGYRVCLDSLSKEEKHVSKSLIDTTVLEGSDRVVTVPIEISESGIVESIGITRIKMTGGDLSEVKCLLTSPSGRSVVFLNSICPGQSEFDIGIADVGRSLIECPLRHQEVYKSVDDLGVLRGESAKGLWLLSIVVEEPSRVILDVFSLDIGYRAYGEVVCLQSSVEFDVVAPIDGKTHKDTIMLVGNGCEDVDVLENDFLIDTTSMTIKIIQQGAHGIGMYRGNGVFEYCMNQSFSGWDSVVYELFIPSTECSMGVLDTVVLLVFRQSPLNIEKIKFDYDLKARCSHWMSWEVDSSFDITRLHIIRKVGGQIDSLEVQECNYTQVNFEDQRCVPDGIEEVLYSAVAHSSSSVIKSEWQGAYVDEEEDLLFHVFGEYIIWPTDKGIREVYLFDSYGRHVLSEYVESGRINMANSPQGIYYVRFKLGSKIKHQAVAIF